VAGVTTEFKRNLLRGLAWDAQDRALTLEAVLKEACRARLEETKTGKVLTMAAGNGSQAQFSLPQAASRMSPAEVDSACEQLYTLYESTLVELATDGVDSPTDAQILARMLSLLVRRNEAYSDRSRIVSIGVLGVGA
jgi:hypothetical protein